MVVRSGVGTCELDGAIVIEGAKVGSYVESVGSVVLDSDGSNDGRADGLFTLDGMADILGDIDGCNEVEGCMDGIWEGDSLCGIARKTTKSANMGTIISSLFSVSVNEISVRSCGDTLTYPTMLLLRLLKPTRFDATSMMSAPALNIFPAATSN